MTTIAQKRRASNRKVAKPRFDSQCVSASLCIAQKRRASNRKVAKPRFDSQCVSASLCIWKRHLMLFPTLEPSSLSVWWPSLTKDMQTEQFLCWSGMTDTKHRATSSSIEEEAQKQLNYIIQRTFKRTFQLKT